MRVQGFGVQGGSRFRAEGLGVQGFGVQGGLGFRVEGLFRVPPKNVEH